MDRSLYRRPAKPLAIPVTRRQRLDKLDLTAAPAPVIIDKSTECHVTPDDVAARMVEYLGQQGDYLTLEPSAGTGQLVKALLASGHSGCEIVMVERHIALAGRLHSITRGAGVLCRDFLEWAAEVRGKVEFPRVIMNPPFRDVRKHVAAAVELLGRHGHTERPCLVALVPITFERDDAETLEALPVDTFATAKVNTKIIRIYGE